MKHDRLPFVIIGIVVVIVIVGLVAYALNRQANDGYMQDMEIHGQSGQSNEADREAASGAVETNTVVIENYLYGPKTITVKLGTKVTWTNQDASKHTVTTQDGAPAKIDSGLFGKGESYSFTFDKVGTYEYYCEPHPYMKGTVIVTD